MDTMRVWRIIISAGTTFVIIGCGSLGVALISSEGRPLSKTAIAASLLTAAVAAAKDVRSLLCLPPLTNGSADALNALLKNDPLLQAVQKARVENGKDKNEQPTGNP